MKIFAAIALIALFLIMPITTIWSVNTLFMSPIDQIPLELSTWASALWLQLMVSGGLYASK